MGVTRPQTPPDSQGQGQTGSWEAAGNPNAQAAAGGKEKASLAQAGEKLKDTAKK